MPHAYSDDALTLARLLQEPVLRRARIHAGRAGAVTRLDWVAPWSVASRRCRGTTMRPSCPSLRSPLRSALW